MASSNGKWVNPVPSQVDKGSSLALQSLTSYLGGWVDDHGRSPIIVTILGGVETRGNATVISQYRLQGDVCFWYGHYTIGTTTSWPGGAGANIGLRPPYQFEKSTFGPGPSMCGGMIRAARGAALVYGAYETSGNALFPNSIATGAAWVINNPASTPLAGGTWNVGDIISWNVWFRVQV